ncbi:MAG TPA: hypothetical protein VHA76_15550 [Solirubrobacterales bacterium]|nr:hypothetical protein [Solirubrobacterales bacterium]
MRRLAAAAALAATLASLLAAGPAAAEFGPIRLVSRTFASQAREASEPVLSADGHYMALRAVMDGGQMGVFRVDLETGEVTRVETGAAPEGSVKAEPLATAKAPSISADGRYVSFTTTAPLAPALDPQPGTEDVYVADMSTSPPTYELASVAAATGEAMITPSQAAPRVALDADGREVAFVSGGEVYLRDLETRETTLVSVARDPLTGAMEPGVPVPGGTVVPKLADSVGAALSADGTTVAWLGTNLPAQVPLLTDEKAKIVALEANGGHYDEPLWRRVADGPSAPTRRIVGGGDPLAPGCPGEAGTLAEPACRGPFPGLIEGNYEKNVATGWLGRPEPIDGVPQLSADGDTVALIGSPTEAANLFLVDMAPGLSRVQAVRQLTAQVPVSPGAEGPVVDEEKYVPLNGHVYDVAISADGRHVAFATARQRFPIAPPNLATPAPVQLGLVELYDLDLENEAMRRVTHGLGGESEPSLATSGQAQGGIGASSPSFGAGDRLLGFSSAASNLVAGDGNEAGDAFVVEDVPGSRAATTSVPDRPQPAGVKRRNLVVSAFSMPNGKVKVVAVTPASGSLAVRAEAPLGARSRPRRVAAGKATARTTAPVKVVLALPRRLRRLARSGEGLYAEAAVAFHRAGGGTVRRRLEIRFHAHRPHKGGRR